MFDAGSIAVLAPFLMVVGIVWVRSQAQLEEKRIAAGITERGESDPQQAKQIVELQERVRVLERIVTDNSYDLAGQIEALRNQRGLSDQRQAAQSETLERAG
jgi:hypothetical protein